jgi:cob(I)alamin adenosyltransferase
MFEDFKKKDSVVVVYTGDSKGKTSASLGLMLRGLGAGWKVSYIQFVKRWEVSEHKAIHELEKVYDGKLDFFKGGKGFYDAGAMSAKNVSESEHKQAAEETLSHTIAQSTSGEYDLVICDEINNAVNDGLLDKIELKKLIENRSPKTSLCFTGRNFPEEFIDITDIATNMTKLKHHFDDKYLANVGIDY